jgi:hypothetical protein
MACSVCHGVRCTLMLRRTRRAARPARGVTDEAHSPSWVRRARSSAEACGSDSSVDPTNQQPTDLNQVLSEITLPSLSGATSLAGVSTQGITAPIPSGCTYSTSTQSFACPAVTVSGLSVTQSYTLLDASGRPQSAYDPASTASVRLKTTIVGTITADGNSLMIDEAQDLTLSGLLTGMHTIDGTSTTTLNGTVKSGSTSVTTANTVTTTISKLVVPKETAGASSYPSSGTITIDVETVDSGFSATLLVQVTFNGTSKVGVVISSGIFTQHCTMDLANPNATCA